MEAPIASSGGHVQSESGGHFASILNNMDKDNEQKHSIGEGAKVAPTQVTPITGGISRARKGVPLHTCERCSPPKSFTRVEHLRQHQLSHPPLGPACPEPESDKVFHRKDSFERDQIRHQSEIEGHAATLKSGSSTSSHIEIPSINSHFQMQPTGMGLRRDSYRPMNTDPWSNQDLNSDNNHPFYGYPQRSEPAYFGNLGDMGELGNSTVFKTAVQSEPQVSKDQDTYRHETGQKVTPGPRTNRATSDRAQPSFDAPSPVEVHGLSQLNDGSIKASDNLNNIDVTSELVESDNQSSSQHTFLKPNNSSDPNGRLNLKVEKAVENQKAAEAADRGKLMRQLQESRYSDCSTEEDTSTKRRGFSFDQQVSRGHLRLRRKQTSSRHGKQTRTERSKISGGVMILEKKAPRRQRISGADSDSDDECDSRRCREPGCMKEFIRRHDLKKHEKTHSGPWKCLVPVCEYEEFVWPSEKSRDRHVSDEHPGVTVTYECQFQPCYYKSQRESSVEKHMENTHNEERFRSNDELFEMSCRVRITYGPTSRYNISNSSNDTSTVDNKSDRPRLKDMFKSSDNMLLDPMHEQQTKISEKECHQRIAKNALSFLDNYRGTSLLGIPISCAKCGKNLSETDKTQYKREVEGKSMADLVKNALCRACSIEEEEQSQVARISESDLDNLAKGDSLLFADDLQNKSELKQELEQTRQQIQAQERGLLKIELEKVQSRPSDSSFQDENDKGLQNLHESEIRNTALDSDESDSDASDTGSIRSMAISVASSATSVGDLPDNAVLGLAGLLVKHEYLKDSFRLAAFEIGTERFQRNFRRLLVQYGQALRKEVKDPIESEIARFVRNSATKLSVEVKRGTLQLVVAKSDLEPPALYVLNGYIRNLEQRSENARSSGKDDENDEEENEQETSSSLQSLERVEKFLTSGQAFVEFRNEMRAWIYKALKPHFVRNNLEDSADSKWIGDPPEFPTYFLCPYCDEAFDCVSNQMKHLRNHVKEGTHEYQLYSDNEKTSQSNGLTHPAREGNDPNSKRMDIELQAHKGDACSLDNTTIQEPHSGDKSQERRKDLLLVAEEVLRDNIRKVLTSFAALIAFFYSFLMISMHLSIEAPGHGVYSIFMSTEIPAKPNSRSKACLNTSFSVDWTRFRHLIALVFVVLTASELAKVQIMLLGLLGFQKQVTIPILAAERGLTKKAILRETILLATLLVASSAQIREFRLDMPLYPTITGKLEKVWELLGMFLPKIPMTGLLVVSSAAIPWRKPLWNSVLDWMQPNPRHGYCRVSWTCRCGKRLHMQVPQTRQDKAIEFVQKAAGDDNTGSISLKSSAGHNRSPSPSTSSVSSNQYSEGRSSSSESGTTTTEPSLEDSQSGCNQFLPAGTKKYMLLCVNSGRRLIRLSNVDVTDLDDDEEVFAKMRASYEALRGTRARNPFMKPTTMHYVEFRLIHLKKSLDCVGSYQPNRIPTEKEVISGEYAFNPCPPEHSDVPIDPEVFMHVFTTPGDHLGGMAAEMLPKKLHSQLLWDKNVHRATHLPRGWGFYIVEGIDWAFVRWCLFGLVLAVTVLTIVWSVVKEDVQGGTGIGQYCIGALAMLSTIFLFSGGLGDSRL